jgi:type IV pilus assembly protein PilO
MRIGPRELLFFLVLAAMPLAAYFWPWQTPVRGIRQWNQQIAEARQEIRNKQDKLKKLEQATTRIENLGQEIDRLTRSIKMFEKKLPAQRQVEVVLKEVWQLARKHDLTPQSVRTDKIVPAAHYAELPIKMEISGDFDGFYSFLIDLEKMPRITQIPTMRMQKKENNEESGQMKAEMVLSIFFESAKDSKGGQQKASAI